MGYVVNMKCVKSAKDLSGIAQLDLPWSTVAL